LHSTVAQLLVVLIQVVSYLRCCITFLFPVRRRAIVPLSDYKIAIVIYVAIHEVIIAGTMLHASLSDAGSSGNHSARRRRHTIAFAPIVALLLFGEERTLINNAIHYRYYQLIDV